MQRRTFLRLAGGVLATAALGLTTLGCNHKHGRQIPNDSPRSADLVVNNAHHDTLHVYIDGGKIGEAPAFGQARFQILSGYRRIAVRERGSTFREDLGEFYFGYDEVTITYRA